MTAPVSGLRRVRDEVARMKMIKFFARAVRGPSGPGSRSEGRARWSRNSPRSSVITTRQPRHSGTSDMNRTVLSIISIEWRCAALRSRSSVPTLSGTQSFPDEKRKKYRGMVLPTARDGRCLKCTNRALGLGAQRHPTIRLPGPLGTTFCWAAHGQRTLNVVSLEVLARLSEKPVPAIRLGTARTPSPRSWPPSRQRRY